MNTKTITFAIVFLTILLNKLNLDETVHLGILISATIISLIINWKKISLSPPTILALIVTALIGVYYYSLS
jgi:hypothetical protein